MSYGYWPKPAPKKPPPVHGIKMKKAGSTWWGQRWIEALQEVLSGDVSRLARGRTYARAGRTHDLVVTGGKVTAKVTGSRPTPYKITIQVAELSDAVWKKAIAGMAEKAQFAADLLAGQMPKEIDEVFHGAGSSLFPKKRADLVTNCSCPDWGDPCKHVAATHYVLGEALDRDPFLLFELRGKTKNQVLEALRVVRGGGELTSKQRSEKLDVALHEVPTVTLAALKPSDYNVPREALPLLHFTFEEPATHGSVLRQLGTPASWSATGTPADVLGPMVRAAAEKARGLAMAESIATDEEIAVAASEALKSPKARKTAKKQGA